MCVCVYIYAYVGVCVCVCVCVHYINAYIYIHTCMHTCIHTYREVPEGYSYIHTERYQRGTHTHIQIGTRGVLSAMLLGHLPIRVN